ncbi:hypothetical protein MNBD_IGNAVI01-1316 [hydrothermal vent metagenome]|uniref:FMN-binding domain-containing protein n=1 Tax=hydrothermal vent metagenome TaxID=652676 RepID=A0A3B1CGL3_9ZZZZ
MKTLFLIFTIFSISSFNLVFGNEIQNRTEEILRTHFGEDITITYKKYDLDRNMKSNIENQIEQRFFSDYIYIWQVESNDSLKAIALMDNVYGKTLPITFLVIFKLDGSISSTHIIKYREDHGGAVTSENWNEQFDGKDSRSTYIIGEDIQGISGATISVRSITKGIQKLTLLYDEIRKAI